MIRLPASARRLAVGAAFVALMSGLCSPQASAAPFAVDLGGVRIALDAPAGFSDTAFIASPRISELAEALTSASNRILLFALSDADVRRFTLGDRPDLRRYMLVVTPRGLERTSVSEHEFSIFVESALRGLGTPPEGTNYQAYMDTRPRGQASVLAELRKGPAAVAVIQGARMAATTRRADEPPRYLLSSTALMRLRGRALQLSVYSAYDTPEDFEWLRRTTTDWMDDLERLNNR